MPLELFESLKDRDVNPKQVLKNKILFKPDTIEIKKGNPVLKVLEYLQKTKTLKMIFFLDQSFGIGLK